MSELFENLSNALADTVAAVNSGVVRVEGRKRLAATGIAWDESHVITAHHVLKRDDGIQVALPDGSKASAVVVGRDKQTDVAVLRVEGGGLTPLAQAEAGSLRVGHLALAIGRPGDHLQTTLGIISALGTGRMDGLIQTDVVMYPGFSGGPLIDAAGKVQGMNTSGLNRGVSLAISTHWIQQIASTLIEHGHMRQGYLGVGAQPVRLPQAMAAEAGQETGLLLSSVEAGSPGEQGGLLQGDVILALDGEPTPHLDALLMLLTGTRVGQAVPVRIIRGGQITEVTVTIGTSA